MSDPRRDDRRVPIEPSPRTATFVGLALFILTLAFRGWQLGAPRTFVLDEAYYANDALDLFTRGSERALVLHPPFAKWLISIGFATSRFSPTTWRVSALVVGASVVVLAYGVVLRLTRSLPLALVAAVLILSDGVAHATGRYALLDGFTAFFTTAILAVLLVTIDRPATMPTAAALGVLSGLGVATKWAAAPVVIVAFAVFLGRCRRDVQRLLVLSAVLIGTLLLSYFATYTPWVVAGGPFGNCTSQACHRSPLDRAIRLPAIQRDMLSANLSFSRQTGATSPGWQWPAEPRSMVLFDQRCDGVRIGACHAHSSQDLRVTARTNPALWLSGLVVITLWSIRRIVRRVGSTSVAITGAAGIALWAPWAVQSTAYQYYAAPIVPALAIAFVIGLHDMAHRRERVLGCLVAAVAAVFFLGTHTGVPWSA